jgi:hypothetical protein
MPYETITGYIENIYEGETKGGKSYLGIKFYTNDRHENESYHEISLYFSKAALQITQEKIERLFEIAGLEYSGPKPTTVKAAVKKLAREEFVALEIPITVQENEYEDRVKAQYDIGWVNDGEPLGLVESGFGKFSDLLAERMAKIKGAKSDPREAALDGARSPEVTVVDDSSLYDEIPF